MKLKSYLTAVLWQIIVGIFITGFACYIALAIRDNLLTAEQNMSDLISYSAFIGLFISVISLYARQMYFLFFTRKHKQSEVFPILYNFKNK